MSLRQWWNQIDSSWQQWRSGQEDRAYVEALYRDLLGRPPEKSSLSNALQALREGNLNRRQLRQMLLQAPESQAYRLVRELYQDLLGRDPTPDERWSAVQQIQKEGIEPETLLPALRETTEYRFRTADPPPQQEPYQVPHPPQQVWLELTTRCNLHPPCIMCGKSADTERRETDMEPQIWQRLLPFLKRAHTVGLHGGGEPLLYPQFFDLLEQLDPTRTGVGFNSNGHLLTPDTSRRLIEHQVSWISISLDAASPEIYLRLRRSRQFERVLAKIRRLRELRDQLGSSRPRIDINMTVMRTNLSEVVPFIELAADLGLRNVTFQQIIPGGDWSLEAPDGYHFDYRQEELSTCLPQHAEVMAAAWERAQELGVALDYEIAYQGSCPDWPQTEPVGSPLPTVEANSSDAPCPSPPKALCPDPWTTMMVYVDGSTTFCCYHHPDAILGNVASQSPEAVWNGAPARLVRSWLLEAPFPRCCEGCFRVWS